MRRRRDRTIPIALLCLTALFVPNNGNGIGARRQNEPAGLHMILVETAAEASDLRTRIEGGESFERLAREYSLDPSAGSGGYLGRLSPSDLRPEFQAALEGVGPGIVSPVTPVGGGYILLRIMTAGEREWMDANDQALALLERGQLDTAVGRFGDAVRLAETFGPEDYRLGETLNTLAAIFRLQEDWAEAEPLYRRVLSIREANLGPEHADVAASLNNLAEVLRFQGNRTEAEPLYRRSLSILETVLGPDHPNVAQSLNNLAQLLEAGKRYEDAEALLRRSVDILERTLGPDHVDLAAGLHNLAQVLEASGRVAEAEPVARRSISILERVRGPDDPDVATGLSRLGRLLTAEGEDTEAIDVYRRAFGIRWAGAAARGASVIALLDRFTAVVLRAYFLDEAYEGALEGFRTALSGAAIREDLYNAMSSLLVEVAREDDAEIVMRAAVDAYPASWRARYELGEVFVEAGKLQRALEEMRTAVEMRADPPLEAPQRSFVHQRMGDILTELLNVGAAEAAYETSLELDPTRVESLLALADLYLRDNRLDEAARRYREAIALRPTSIPAYTGLADIHLREGAFDEAIEEADRALAFDSDAGLARYHRARALLQTGRRDEGQVEMRAYQAVQADQQAAENLARDVYVLNRDAADTLTDGDPAEAIRLFREAIARHPDQAAFRFNLAVAQSGLGDHRAAIDTLEAMIGSGIGDDFLSQHSLAMEYEALGDLEAATRHRAAYLRELDATLAGRVE